MEKLYKCTLLTDVVLNSKLATEGNMTTLDYIPGSNFMGIVAGALYSTIPSEMAYDLFHSEKVLFGDAYICDKNTSERSYPVPFSVFEPKNKGEKRWVHHLLNEKIYSDLQSQSIQLKQLRSGFITPDGQLFDNIKKNFALKSAYDRKERRSKERAMFGFESLPKGQTFLFSVHFNEERYFEEVNKVLVGTKRVGKSKTAQYGQVKIELLDESKAPKQIGSFQTNDYVLVYAESNLCFYNELGQPTFQPSIKDLGLESGEIDWKNSQVRTYSYSPWNAKRNTSGTQRDCIAKGSVFYIRNSNASPSPTSAIVGEYQSEGLGRVIYNPEFLQGDTSTGEWKYIQKAPGQSAAIRIKLLSQETVKTALGQFLLMKKNDQKVELQISQAVHQALLNSKSEGLTNVTASQWGAIRTYATETSDIEKLETILFEDVLTRGVAYDRIWGRNNEQYLKKFKSVFKENKHLKSKFVAKYAAEMAKISKKD